jgi:hypothetical protein
MRTGKLLPLTFVALPMPGKLSMDEPIFQQPADA